MARRAGMTLIEVLLAAALLGVGMTAMLTAASRCLAVYRVAKRYQEVQWTLHMGELEHPLLLTVEPEEWAVPEETYDNGMTFSREVEEPAEDKKDGLYTVRTRVAWSEQSAAGSEEFVQLVFLKDKVEP